MKAEIDEKGTLKLSPESALEAYALRHWSEWYKPEITAENDSSRSVLSIDLNWPLLNNGADK